MRKRYLIERIGGEDGVRVTVYPTPDACPVCGGALGEFDPTAAGYSADVRQPSGDPRSPHHKPGAVAEVYCTTHPDHTRRGWMLPYLLSEVDTGKGHGFEYGYGGTGPAVFAASLVADLFAETPTRERFSAGSCRAFVHMETVKWRFVAPLDQETRQHWLDGDELIAFCREHERTCDVCSGTGVDPEGWCEVCGAPNRRPCYQEDGEGTWTRHEYTPAKCYACLGLAVQRVTPAAT